MKRRTRRTFVSTDSISQRLGRFFDLPVLASADAGDYPEPRFIGIGFLRERVVVVVFNQPNEGTIRIISLRKALKHERTQFEEFLRNELGTN